jgi:hypothetical protein
MSTDHTRHLIERHWATANARDWAAFARLLHPALRYEVPQTREYIEGAAGYLDMFVTWPGAWVAHTRNLVCEGEQAVCEIAFVVDGQTMTGIGFFLLQHGLIAHVTDWWPEPYEPPPRESAYMRRRPAAAAAQTDS